MFKIKIFNFWSTVSQLHGIICENAEMLTRVVYTHVQVLSVSHHHHLLQKLLQLLHVVPVSTFAIIHYAQLNNMDIMC